MVNLQLKLNDEFKAFVVKKEYRSNIFTNTNEPGIRYAIRFPNEYGASIIKFPGSYGYELDLWELALLSYRSGKQHLIYTDLVENDVLGYLTDEQVNKVLKYIYEGKLNENINIYEFDED